MTSPPADMRSVVLRVDSAAHWIELFTEAFRAGHYAAVARLAEYIHPEYRGVQPRMPDAVGRASLLDIFARVYALVPDLRGEVLHANIYDGGVYIEARLSGTLGGRRVTWNTCDRFWFQDRLVKGRVTYFDPLDLLASVAGQPRAWRRWWRSGLGPPSRRISKRVDPRVRNLKDWADR
ncbi:nuclear transport factor 2 family protein [Mycobacterium colombiense]|uniref:nuclear transport factor 2 family protein n=1 Tax=Mycobacterium colombiense TaxID=339268 RepID=UPI00200A6F50|nr:nuclear transport factor 2 family protein [Mycobacterium colombiense]MCK8642377.1 nuclear transport factor 2 family protein [Mycobacterium colombiense]